MIKIKETRASATKAIQTQEKRLVFCKSLIYSDSLAKSGLEDESELPCTRWRSSAVMR